MKEVNNIKSSEYLLINSAKQNILTMTTDKSNPILLILHGGPGSPDRPLVYKYNRDLAKYFTVICWDQRGCGLSYCKDRLSVAMLINDLNSLVDILCKKYNQKKVVISGHSWGAYLGLKYSSMYPDKIYAYIGTGQGVSSNDKIEKYNFCLRRATDLKESKNVEKLLEIKAPVNGNYASDNVQSKQFVSNLVHRYGGYIHPNSNINMKKYVSIYIKHYGINIFKVIKGIKHSLACLRQEMLDNENTGILKLNIPIKIIQGEWDYICPNATVKQWFDNLQAPKKEFAVIKNAAHMVNFEQPEDWNKEVKEFIMKFY